MIFIFTEKQEIALNGYCFLENPLYSYSFP